MTGSTTIPLWAFLTRLTSRAWWATERFLCTIPIPPERAMAMAVSPSVTVSIAELTNGIRSSRPTVSRVRVSTSLGKTSENAGSRRTSSKVSPSRIRSPSGAGRSVTGTSKAGERRQFSVQQALPQRPPSDG